MHNSPSLAVHLHLVIFILGHSGNTVHNLFPAVYHDTNGPNSSAGKTKQDELNRYLC